VKLLRFNLFGRSFWGFGSDAGVTALKLPDGVSPFELDVFETEGETLPWEVVRLVAPVQPSKIVCVGVNYVAHASEMQKAVPEEPLLFLKPPSALNGPEGRIVHPPQSKLVHHEGELGVVIGKRARWISRSEAIEHVFGLTCFNDVTARDLQRKDVQFTRGKGFDTFACVGPWIVRGLDPADLRVCTRVNGETRQDGRTSQMVFDVPTLVSTIARIMTLEPGDLIATGTPEGVGPLLPGDSVEVEVEGVGVLRNSVIASPHGEVAP